MSTVNSHVKRGHVYIKNAGSYNEVGTNSINGVNNDSSSSKKQRNLAPKGKNSAASKTFQKTWKELGW